MATTLLRRAYTRRWNTSATLTSLPFRNALIPNIRNERPCRTIRVNKVFADSEVRLLFQASGFVSQAASSSVPRPRRAGNHHNGYTSGTKDCPFWVSSDAYRALRRHLSESVDASMAVLVPERVMVRAVGHWSNTTSLRAYQCRYWSNRSCHQL